MDSIIALALTILASICFFGLAVAFVALISFRKEIKKDLTKC